MTLKFYLISSKQRSIIVICYFQAHKSNFAVFINTTLINSILTILLTFVFVANCADTNTSFWILFGVSSEQLEIVTIGLGTDIGSSFIFRQVLDYYHSRLLIHQKKFLICWFLQARQCQDFNEIKII